MGLATAVTTAAAALTIASGFDTSVASTFAFVEMEPRGLRRRAGVGVAGDGAAGGTKSSANDSITLAHWVDLCRELQNELDAVRGGADRNDLCCELQGERDAAGA